jgi:hypothetical protein
MFEQEHPRFSKPLAGALKVWRGYLLGKTARLGAHPVWFVLLDFAIAPLIHQTVLLRENGGRGASPALNRYLVDSLNQQVVAYDQDGYALIWAKVGLWLIIGVIEAPDRADSDPVELFPMGGTFPLASHTIPPVVLATLGFQSWHFIDGWSRISDRQRAKIQQRSAKHGGSAPGSLQSLAFQEDIRIFGDAARIRAPRRTT